MFGLIRRISYSVIPRPDRPWEDDPTSNAPNTRRKRRISSTERENGDMTDEEHARKKKIRSDSELPGSDDIPSSPILSATDVPEAGNEGTDNDTEVEAGDNGQQEGTPEFKAVTKGVKAVVLEDKETEANASSPDEEPVQSGEVAVDSKASVADEGSNTVAADVNPEAIPLPEEKAGELDEEPPSPPAPEPEPLHTRESSAATAVESSKIAPRDTENPPSQPEKPRITGSSRSSASSAKKLRSKSPKKVSARA